MGLPFHALTLIGSVDALEFSARPHAVPARLDVGRRHFGPLDDANGSFVPTGNQIGQTHFLDVDFRQD